MRLTAFITLLMLPLATLAASATKPAVAAAPPKPLRVLFIGNSYTQVNDLPAAFRKVAVGARMPAPLVDSITPGGKTLKQHLEDPKTLEKIDGGYGPKHEPWDVVILQEQSQTPAFADVDPRHGEWFLAGSVGLYDRVKAKSPAAKIVLYETWARHADYFKNPPDDHMGKDAAEMQARLTKWYAKAADNIRQNSKSDRKDDVAVAGVGQAWARELTTKNPIRLHAPDHSHPAFAGTYLAALVIFDTIYQPAKLQTTERGTLTAAEAKHLQEIAAEKPRGDR